MGVHTALQTFRVAAVAAAFVFTGAASAQLQVGGLAGGLDWDPQEQEILLSAPIEAGLLYLRRGVLATADMPDLRFEGAGALLATHRGVIAFDGPLTNEQRHQLSAAGVTLGEYLPAFAYHVDLRMVHPGRLVDLPFVRWVGRYDESWKIDPEVGTRAAMTPLRQALSNAGLAPLAITLFPGESLEGIEQSLIDMGADVHGSETIAVNEVLTVTMPLRRVAGLALLGAVMHVEEAPEITLRNNNARWVVQSNQSGVTPLYAAGLRGEGQIVGILDGRVDRNHCSFVDSAPIGNGHRKIQAYNTTAGADSHGTHVAGTVVGDGGSNNSNRGVAYMGRFVFHTTPSYNESGIRNRLIQHHNQGARIHTNSWGDDSTTAYNSLARGFDSFARDYEDSLSLLAVTNTSSLRNPENAKNLLAVGATSPPPNQHQHCTGGAGPTSDGRRKPEVYAPGCSTVSSRNSTSCNTRTLSGTSMATPAVAGVGMLMRQYFTAGYYPTGQPVPSNSFVPTGALVKAMLVNSATDMTGVSGYPSNLEGWGRVLARDTVFFPGSARNLHVFDVRNSQGLTTGQQTEYQMTVSGSSQRLKVTLVWTDVPGTAGTSFAAVNDLDLEVINPGGTLYRGNVFSGGSSAPGGSRDDRNNVEQVHINNPAAGNWVIRVKGTAVNSGLQGYALVVTGQVSSAGSEPPPPPPANDLCSNATVVSEGVHAFTTVSAGTDGPDFYTSCGGFGEMYSDVWFRYSPQCAGTVTIRLCNLTFAGKARVYLLPQGACPSSVSPVFSCVDDCTGVAEVVSDGAPILIRIGAANMNVFGDGTLTIEMECEEPNATCPADLDGSGIVDLTDLLQLLAAWGPCTDCPEDLDSSGIVDLSDLLALLGAWGACP